VKFRIAGSTNMKNVIYKHPKKIVKIYTYQLKQTTYHLKLEVIIPKNQSKNKHKIDFVNNNL